ncbi:hypothetical protein CP97_08720 [Aurantiacibacter atlanticus]|uniref:Uncharacterized protein n=1 Tax=Aurantiacibacter atlanticus TaxID=1648404 RepID=A0A0H4VG49_9SPHN|nr:hypothetical protein [Aurantiacibacter atlanticus]AKQ42084.1 hypothetical protein CP97_08720 [Aurantiacibacter atlanticus]
MTWLAAIVLAIIAFAIAAFAFRLPRALWTSLAAALLFGLAGYAFQASPQVPSAPKSASLARDRADFDIPSLRREFVAEHERSRSSLLFQADAMMRRGRFVEASQFLAGITHENPADFEAWLALGNALAEHADGALTEPALYAYRQAAMLSPGHPGPGYFIGVSYIRQGQYVRTRDIWAQTLEAAPLDTAGRGALAERLARLDAMLDAASQVQQGNAAGPTDHSGSSDPARDGE